MHDLTQFEKQRKGKFMITSKEILDFNKILQEKCDNQDDCSTCPLKRKYPYYGCIKDYQEDKIEAEKLVKFVYKWESFIPS